VPFEHVRVAKPARFDAAIEAVDQDREVLLHARIAFLRHGGGEFGFERLRTRDVAFVRVEREVEGQAVVLLVTRGRGAFGIELRFEVDQLLRVGIARIDPCRFGGDGILRGRVLREGGRGGQEGDERNGGGEGFHRMHPP